MRCSSLHPRCSFPLWTRKLADGCTGDVLSSAILAHKSLLFHRRRLFAPLFPRGSVNACSFLAPVLMHGDRENRVKPRDMSIQAGEDLLEHDACLLHAFTLTSHLG